MMHDDDVFEDNLEETEDKTHKPFKELCPLSKCTICPVCDDLMNIFQAKRTKAFQKEVENIVDAAITTIGNDGTSVFVHSGKMIVEQKRWGFINDLITQSLFERDDRWTKFYQPVIHAIVDAAFTNPDKVDENVRAFSKHMSTATFEILLTRVGSRHNAVICQAVQQSGATGSHLAKVCNVTKRRLEDRIYESTQFENYDLFIDIFDWI